MNPIFNKLLGLSVLLVSIAFIASVTHVNGNFNLDFRNLLSLKNVVNVKTAQAFTPNDPVCQDGVNTCYTCVNITTYPYGWYGCNPSIGNCWTSNPHCTANPPGTPSMQCENACPAGYYNWGQIGTCNCGNPAYDCRTTPPCTPSCPANPGTCGAWGGGSNGCGGTCPGGCNGNGNCVNNCAKDGFNVNNGYASDGCGNPQVCSPGTCPPGSDPKPTTPCTSGTYNTYNSSCQAVANPYCNGGASCVTAGQCLKDNAGKLNGQATDSCGGPPVCNTAVCTPGTDATCGTTQTYNPDCSVKQICVDGTPSTCNWVCDNPTDGYSHSPCAPSSSYCATNPNDTQHCSKSAACSPAWVQASGGDVHANGPINNVVIPNPSNSAITNASNFFNYFSPGSYGIVSSTKAIDFKAPFGQISPAAGTDIKTLQTNIGNPAVGTPNIRSWVMSNYGPATGILLNPRFDFWYFWNRFHLLINTDTSTPDSTISKQSDVEPGDNNYHGIYPSSGCTVTVTPDKKTGKIITFPDEGKSQVVFIHENPNSPCPNHKVDLVFGPNSGIDSNPATPGYNSNIIVFIVSGNVIIDPSVTKADAFFVTERQFWDKSQIVNNTSPADVPLNIFGGIVAYGCDQENDPTGCSVIPPIQFDRKTTTGSPAEKITYNPNVMQLVNSLGQTTFSWTEVTP